MRRTSRALRPLGLGLAAAVWLVAAAPVLAPRSTAHAAVPALVNYQGRLLRTDGTPEAGILPLVFSVYDVASGGTALWTETQSVAFTDGFYSVLLGSVAPLAPAVTDGTARWLAVTVDGVELAPRQQIVSVPFALRAGTAEALVATGSGSGLDADSVDGLEGTDLATASHTHPTYALSTHTHAAGDATTLDGIDSAGFATAAHAHTGYASASHTHSPASAIDWSGMTVLSSGTYTGDVFAANLTGGTAMCPASYHTCNAWEWTIFDILGRGAPGSGWVAGGFNNIDYHLRSLVNGQDSVVCPAGAHLTAYSICCGNEPGWAGYYGRLHCQGDASALPVMCCRNAL